MLRAIRRVAAAGLLLFAVCPADRLSSGNAAWTVGTTGSSSPAAVTTSTAGASCAPRGGVARITIQSQGLSRPIRVSIVSPATTQDVVGVVYLLHGSGTDESQWEAIGIEAALDDLVATGQSRPFTVVLPDLPTGGDPGRDGAAFLNDVVPAIERCLGGPRPAAHRALGGISRGGSLALEVVADHGDEFAAVGGHSPAVAGDDVTSLAQRIASSHVRVWLDVGTEDALKGPTQQLATALTDAGSAPELQVSPGGHDRAYWGAHLRDYLRWYGSAISSA